MRNNLLLFSVLLLFDLGLTGIQAQETILAAGITASGSGGTISYSIGQVVYTSYTGTTGLLAQGVQQPYDISVVNGIAETEEISLRFSAYPNPTTDYLTLIINRIEFVGDPSDFSTLSFQLFDLNGKLLKSELLTGNETNISMEDLLKATYLLKVIQGNNGIKTFKIIKK